MLDLDNTLVVTGPAEPASAAPEEVLRIKATDAQPQQFCQRRPFVVQFLKFVNELFDIAIFTASSRELAIEKVEWLEGCVGFPFRMKLWREDCVKIAGLFLKDLRMFEASDTRPSRARRSTPDAGQRSLRDIVLIEDCVFAGAFTPDSASPDDYIHEMTPFAFS